ncbi:MAG: hypothetical protein MUF46_01345 [Desulfobacterales bacterium]|nr:hypothetical protein [Desulfobacterales bacterium]
MERLHELLQVTAEHRLTIGAARIAMPHAIIDLAEPGEVPADHLVWGFIRNKGLYPTIDIHP